MDSMGRHGPDTWRLRSRPRLGYFQALNAMDEASDPLSQFETPKPIPRSGVGERDQLLSPSLDANQEDEVNDMTVDDDWPTASLVTRKLLTWTSVPLLLLYFTIVLGFFQKFVTVLATIVAIIIIPLAGFVSMRSLGQTDNGASLAIGTLTLQYQT